MLPGLQELLLLVGIAFLYLVAGYTIYNAGTWLSAFLSDPGDVDAER